MKRLLIANRGEIAVRIIRTCREMGISPIAVYSDADRDSLHVGLADTAIHIGPSPPRESYLCMDRIIASARETHADAIHPGYGFLSENSSFSQACADAGVVFVGPSAVVMRALGDKIEAKKRMEAAGVPIVPGYFGEDQSDSRMRKEATAIGFPLMIKAAAGGGGHGMRAVTTEDELAHALDEARREAASAFGDPRLLLERLISRPRHVEVQIFGDQQGNIVHLFERECSIQRRHQKIIEESPSPAVSSELRSRITDAAVRAAKAVGYTNAGTVEFLAEKQDDGSFTFYFMEVNARLQVEHPVTETRTGIDLVKLQLRIAMGQPIPLKQEDVHAAGHAIEARIYAERPDAEFMPSAGKILQWIEPSGPGIRVDSGFRKGGDASPFYDPLLAKLIVHGGTRKDAIDRLDYALRNFTVLGVETNIPYLLDLIRHPDFRSGEIHTEFIDQNFSGWKRPTGIPMEVLLALAGESLTRRSSDAVGCSGVAEAAEFDPWRGANAWRNAG